MVGLHAYKFYNISIKNCIIFRLINIINRYMYYTTEYLSTDMYLKIITIK